MPLNESGRRGWDRRAAFWSVQRAAPGLVVCLLLVMMPVVSQGLARADDQIKESQVEDLVRRGIELRRTHDDQAALEIFRSAYRINPSPRLQAQIGLAEQAVGQWIDAEKDLKGALQATRDPWVAGNIRALRASVIAVEKHLGSLEVLGSPGGALVRVDGREVGNLPLAIAARVTAGEVLVSVSAPGYVEINRKLGIAVGGLTREIFTLHEAPPQSGVSSSEGIGAPGAPPRVRNPARVSSLVPGDNGVREPSISASRAPMEADRLPGPATGNHALSTSRMWGIGLGAAGLAAAGVGAVFVAQALSKNQDSRTGCQGDYCNDTGAELRREALRAGDRATAAFVTATVLVAGGVAILLFARGSSPSAANGVKISPLVGNSGLALLTGSTTF